MAVTLLQFTFYSILIGFVIDLLVGDPRWFPHPVVGIGKHRDRRIFQRHAIIGESDIRALLLPMDS